jgi:hypothetical protein
MHSLAHNTCQWLKYRTTYLCGKKCIGDFCAQHNYQIKRGMKTFPCNSCGIGISHIGTCVNCYGKYTYQIVLREKKRNMKLVLAEILAKVPVIE